MLVAVGTDVEIKPPRRTDSPDAAAAAAAPPSSRIHWSSAGGTAFLDGWQTAEEARALLANFASLAPAKMAKRLGLSLSPAMPVFTELTLEWQQYDAALCSGGPFDISRLTAPPEGVVRFVEWDEVYGRPGDASSGVTTDGWGRLSLDLALRVPKIENGRLMEDGAHTYDPELQAVQGSAPFAMQGRVWVHGNVAKGVWSVDPSLPARTVLVGREKQLKVKGEPGCAAATRGIPSFEVCEGFPCSAGVPSAPPPSPPFGCPLAPLAPLLATLRLGVPLLAPHRPPPANRTGAADVRAAQGR